MIANFSFSNRRVWLIGLGRIVSALFNTKTSHWNSMWFCTYSCDTSLSLDYQAELAGLSKVEPIRLDETDFNFDQCVNVNYHLLQSMLASKMSLQLIHLSYHSSFLQPRWQPTPWWSFLTLQWCGSGMFWCCDVGECSLFGGGDCQGLFVLGFS